MFTINSHVELFSAVNATRGRTCTHLIMVLEMLFDAFHFLRQPATPAFPPFYVKRLGAGLTRIASSESGQGEIRWHCEIAVFRLSHIRVTCSLY